MAQLSTKIKEYCKANGVSDVDFSINVMLQDEMVDGVSNPYIKEWNLDIPQPTSVQLDSYETAGNLAESNQTVIATRKNLYGTWENQLEEIYDDGIDSWKARIQQIKTDNPKG